MYLRPCTCIITWYVCFSQKCSRKVKTSGVSCHKSGVKNIMRDFFCCVELVWLHDFNTSKSHYGQWGVLLYGKNALQHEITSINSSGPSVFAQDLSSEIYQCHKFHSEASNVT